MEVVSTREFRSNQRKYFGMAKGGEDVILKSRDMGSFRLVPVSPNDIVTNKPDITERIFQALREVKLMREGKIKELSMDEFLSGAELQSIQEGLEDIKNSRTYNMQEGESLADFLKRTETCMK